MVATEVAVNKVRDAMSWDCGCSLVADPGWWADVIADPGVGCQLGIDNGYALALPSEQPVRDGIVATVRTLTPETIQTLIDQEWARREHPAAKDSPVCYRCGDVAVIERTNGRASCGDYCPREQCDGDCGRTREDCSCDDDER